jgi:fucose permease
MEPQRQEISRDGANTLAEAELGALMENGSGVLNMAILGGAILPVIGLHHAVILPVLCYLYILFAGRSGLIRGCDGAVA